MSAPETIWIDPAYLDSTSGQSVLACNLGTSDQKRALASDVQYIRADLCITRAEADTMVLAERERCAGIVDECRFNNPMSDTVMLEIIADDIREELRP